MPETIRRLTLAQFRLLLPHPAALARALTAVHVHHTWRPARDDFRGRATIEAMRRFHLAQGWIDIAQHLTVDPLGGLWTGRNWNLPPASARGHNGTLDAGPFMIEIVGNFDKGHDRFDGPQRDTAVDVVAWLLETWGLEPGDVKLHRELTGSQKSCPGSGFDRTTFEAKLAAARRTLRREAAAKAEGQPISPFAREVLAGASLTMPTADLPGENEIAGATVPEHEIAAAAVEGETRVQVAAAQRRYSRDFDRLLQRPAARGEDWADLKPYVVNLSRGELSESGGAFTTSPIDLDAIVDAIADRASADPSMPIVLHAHGGLVEEGDALAYARRMYPWWVSKGVYPVFFVWETALLDVLRQRILGARDLWDWTSDAAIELAAKGPGTLVWADMKGSARRASAPDLGEGYPGGAHLFASKLAGFLQTDAAAGLSVHAVGHSAGAIFHAHLLPALLALGVPEIATLSLLAPAIRTEQFKNTLLPLIESRRIQAHACFTMEEEAEEQDNCWAVYRKSLLYLVSHSFEGLRRRPILGLHRSIRKDAALCGLYGLGADGHPDPEATPLAELQFSYARDKAENPLTRALAHGAFDNDPKTMSTVLRRVVGADDATGLGEADFPYPPLERTIVEAAAVAGTAPVVAGRRIALCIGIDKYRDRPLDGCVNDANAWGAVLTELGYDVRYLRDAEATNRRLRKALEDLIRAGTPGDSLVFQYSGHGTQLADDDGDEADSFDEAFVPVDYHKGELLLLRDDVIATALAELARGVTLTLFMDCCHCGTISRFAPAARAAESNSDRVRYMPPDLLGAARDYRRASLGARSLPTAAPGVIHLAACRDDEFAWESGGQGDFTAAATPRLAEAVRRGDTNERFIRQVSRIVAAKKRQHPLMLPPAAGMSARPLLAPIVSDPARTGTFV
jgi:hypothetical protein